MSIFCLGPRYDWMLMANSIPPSIVSRLPHCSAICFPATFFHAKTFFEETMKGRPSFVRAILFWFF